jgi:hypothetical protein
MGEALGKSRAAVEMLLHRALVRVQQLKARESAAETGGDRGD